MIFVAVGTQFPFDRLIQYMDEWAQGHGSEVVAQIATGEYEPNHINWQRYLDGEQYNNKIKQASVFVSHAGMGNIISARNHGTPIIVVNRQYELGEHRNNHQADGIEWMGKLPGVYTATTKDELFSLLTDIDALKPATSDENQNLQKLVGFISNYIETGNTE